MEETGRYAGLDLGKRACTMAIEGKQGKAVLRNGKTTAEGRQALYRKLHGTDKEDALKPARLLEDTREERLPAVPVPGGREMKRRGTGR